MPENVLATSRHCAVRVRGYFAAEAARCVGQILPQCRHTQQLYVQRHRIVSKFTAGAL